jgi:uncharacterized protein
MHILAGLLSGLLFGAGLVISGMSNPAKVLNFLDLFGTWDPSLAFVMGGAVLVTSIGFRLVLGRSRPWFIDRFHLPTKTDIDPPLLIGSATFGVGWGLSGFCPGPAITALSSVLPAVLLFVVAMCVGMIVARTLQSHQALKPTDAAKRQTA